MLKDGIGGKKPTVWVSQGNSYGRILKNGTPPFRCQRDVGANGGGLIEGLLVADLHGQYLDRPPGAGI
jgi:hypothetical protein